MLKCIIKPHTNGGHYIKTQQTNKRTMARTFLGETKGGGGGQRKAKRCQKKGRASLSCDYIQLMLCY
jgi:hypothetical protein